MIPIIKVLIVDDSALIRQILTRALSLDPRIEIAGTARNGVEAIERAKELQPDVITLDIEMPMLTGLEALPFLIRETQARVIMLTSVDDPGTTYEALDAGAVDFIVKPKGGFASSISDLADVLIKQIKTAYRVNPDKRNDRAGKLLEGLVDHGTAVVQPKRVQATLVNKVVAIGASTGGPPALERVFAGLSADLPAAYVVVQHLPPGFTTSLVQRLGRTTDITVVEGTPNTPLKAGTAYVAPAGTGHMTVTKHGEFARVRIDDGPAIHGVKPAADPLIESVARAYGRNTIGVLLTGMGSDGADGLVAVNGSGGLTIVQDEASSVVWGMPGAAVKRGAAQQVVALDDVAAAIRRGVQGG